MSILVAAVNNAKKLSKFMQNYFTSLFALAFVGSYTVVHVLLSLFYCQQNVKVSKNLKYSKNLWKFGGLTFERCAARSSVTAGWENEGLMGDVAMS